MDKELLGNLKTYSEVYEYVSKGIRTKEELFQHLQEIGKARSTADEQVKKVFTNQVQLLAIDSENVSIDKDKAYSFVSDILLFRTLNDAPFFTLNSAVSV